MRDRYRLSQKALADKLGTTQQAVMTWEHGTSEPRKAMRIKIEELSNELDAQVQFPSKETTLQDVLKRAGIGDLDIENAKFSFSTKFEDGTRSLTISVTSGTPSYVNQSPVQQAPVQSGYNPSPITYQS